MAKNALETARLQTHRSCSTICSASSSFSRNISQVYHLPVDEIDSVIQKDLAVGELLGADRCNLFLSPRIKHFKFKVPLPGGVRKIATLSPGSFDGWRTIRGFSIIFDISSITGASASLYGSSVSMNCHPRRKA